LNSVIDNANADGLFIAFAVGGIAVIADAFIGESCLLVSPGSSFSRASEFSLMDSWSTPLRASSLQPAFGKGDITSTGLHKPFIAVQSQITAHPVFDPNQPGMSADKRDERNKQCSKNLVHDVFSINNRPCGISPNEHIGWVGQVMTTGERIFSDG
jgi:hypothetical protein